MQIRDYVENPSKMTAQTLTQEDRKQFVTDFKANMLKGETNKPNEQDCLTFIWCCAIEKDRESIVTLPNLGDYFSVKLDYSTNNTDKCRTELMQHPITLLAYNHDDESVDFLRSVQPVEDENVFLLYLLADRLDRFQTELKAILTGPYHHSLVFSAAKFCSASTLNKMLSAFPFETVSNQLPVPNFLSNPIGYVYARFRNIGIPSNERLYDWRIREIESAHRWTSKKDVFRLLSEFDSEHRHELINRFIQSDAHRFPENSHAIMDKLLELMNDNKLSFEQAFLWTNLRQNSYVLLLQTIPTLHSNIFPAELLIQINSYIFNLDPHDSFSLLKSFNNTVPQKIFSHDRIQSHTLFHTPTTDKAITGKQEAICLTQVMSSNP